MTFIAHWFSQQGKQTKDNRDCHGVAEHGGDILYIVADGSTSSPTGGQLARALVSTVIKQFTSDHCDVDQRYLRRLIEQTHDILRRDFPADAASYLIATYTSSMQLHTLHAGDCRLGHVTNNDIRWLTAIHTTATAIGAIPEDKLRTDERRHKLTRCFRGKRRDCAEYNYFDLQGNDRFIIATDGFWAEATEFHQQEILSKGTLSSHDYSDDISCLLLEQK